MKRRGAGENSPIKRFVGRAYKVISFQISELKARFLGVRNESWGLVVFEKGVTREITV